ncbi:MAG: hypothetical protein ACRECZ_06200 [Methylocella sp.]
MGARSELNAPGLCNLTEQFKEGEFISGGAFRNFFIIAAIAILGNAPAEFLSIRNKNRCVAARLAALTPPGHKVLIHLTLTDEYPLAQAQVIIEAIATTGAIEATPRPEIL